MLLKDLMDYTLHFQSKLEGGSVVIPPGPRVFIGAKKYLYIRSKQNIGQKRARDVGIGPSKRECFRGTVIPKAKFM